MIYYADYEAVERPRIIYKKNLIPHWLQNIEYETLMIPLVFSVCTCKGNIMHNQDYNTNLKPISFIRFLDSIIKYAPNTMFHKIYFHNLYFDFNIILPELLYNNFSQTILESDYIAYENNDLIYNNVIDKNKVFYVLGDNLKKATGIDILHKGITFKLRDTYKIISSSQNDILKAFGFEEKPEIDFDNMDINNPYEIMNLRHRCQYDVKSLAKSIEIFKNNIKKNYGGEGDTASSIALSSYKNFMGDEYNDYFPNIANTEYEKVSRVSFNGGVCTLSPYMKSGIIHENVIYIDINASYPSTLLENVPFSIPKKIDQVTYDDYSEYVVYIEFEIKKGYIPTIRCSSSIKILYNYGLESEIYHTKDEFPPKFKGFLALTIIDIKILDMFYTYNIKVIKGFKYQTKKLFKKFITKLYDDRTNYKKENNKVLVLAIKLISNSLYGKFAQDLTGEPEFIFKNEKIKIKSTDNKKNYCPVANYITSSGRLNFAKTINIDPSNFIYGDTDSAILTEKADIKNYNIGDKLGEWSIEYDGKPIKKCVVLGKKNYMMKIGNKIIYKCVGLSLTSKKYNVDAYLKNKMLIEKQLNFKNFKIGETFIIQKMVKVYGGLAMRYTTFTLKERRLIYG